MSAIIKNLEDKWLGDKKVKVAEEVGQTSGGVPLVKVTYDDGNTEVFTSKMLELDGVATDTPQDLTSFREKRVYGPVRDCLAVLRDYNLAEKDLSYVIQKIEVSLIENIKQAIRINLGIEKDGDLTLCDVDKIILSKKTTLKEVLGE